MVVPCRALWLWTKKAAGFVGGEGRHSVDAIATCGARVAPLTHKEDARMADQGKDKPSGRKTEDAQRSPGMMAPPWSAQVRAASF